MNWFFKNKKKVIEPECASIWKVDFSDCSTRDYLPAYSFCECDNHSNCRYVALFEGMRLCGNPKHKSFIPEGSEPFDPHKGQFND